MRVQDICIYLRLWLRLGQDCAWIFFLLQTVLLKTVGFLITFGIKL